MRDKRRRTGACILMFSETVVTLANTFENILMIHNLQRDDKIDEVFNPSLLRAGLLRTLDAYVAYVEALKDSVEDGPDEVNATWNNLNNKVDKWRQIILQEAENAS